MVNNKESNLNQNNENKNNNATKQNELFINEIVEEEEITQKTNNPKQKEIDWKELEKWNEIKEEEIKNEYGIDITKLEKDNKKIDTLAKILNITIKTLYIIGKGAVILAIILGLLWVINIFTSAPELIQQMKSAYGIK